MSEENKDNLILRLVNPEFDFEFMGIVYRIRKATLEKAIQYHGKVRELEESKDVASDAKLAAFCVYIMLKDQIKDLTEQKVLENISADIDTLTLLTHLGFISPSKLATVKNLQKTVENKLTGEESL